MSEKSIRKFLKDQLDKKAEVVDGYKVGDGETIRKNIDYVRSLLSEHGIVLTDLLESEISNDHSFDYYENFINQLNRVVQEDSQVNEELLSARFLNVGDIVNLHGKSLRVAYIFLSYAQLSDKLAIKMNDEGLHFISGTNFMDLPPILDNAGNKLLWLPFCYYLEVL